MPVTLDDDKVKRHLERIARLPLNKSLSDYEDSVGLRNGTASSWVRGQSRARLFQELSPQGQAGILDWRAGRPAAKVAFLRRFIQWTADPAAFPISEGMNEKECNRLLTGVKMRDSLNPDERKALEARLATLDADRNPVPVAPFTDSDWLAYGVDVAQRRLFLAEYRRGLAEQGTPMSDDEAYRYVAADMAQSMASSFEGHGVRPPSPPSSSAAFVPGQTDGRGQLSWLAGLRPQPAGSGSATPQRRAEQSRSGFQRTDSAKGRTR